MVREIGNKAYYESPEPPEADHSDSSHPSKKEINPIKEYYSQSPEPGNLKAETSTASENLMAMVQRLSQDAMKEAFSQSVTSDKPVSPEKTDPHDTRSIKVDVGFEGLLKQAVPPETYIDSDDKLLEIYIRDEYRETIKHFTNQSREHFSNFKGQKDLVKENDGRIEILILSIETLIQEAKEKSAGHANKHASEHWHIYMREGYINGIRIADERNHVRLKLYLKEAPPKKEAKETYNRIKELLKEPMPKTLEDLEDFRTYLKTQTDIKTQHFDKRKEVYKEYAKNQAQFINNLVIVQNDLVSAKSPSPSSTVSFDLGEEMIDIAVAKYRPRQGSPDTLESSNP